VERLIRRYLRLLKRKEKTVKKLKEAVKVEGCETPA